jgi:hypothetical protein
MGRSFHQPAASGKFGLSDLPRCYACSRRRIGFGLRDRALARFRVMSHRAGLGPVLN